MMQPPGKKYLAVLFCFLVIPAAIFTAMLSLAGPASAAGSLSQDSLIPHNPFRTPSTRQMRPAPGKFLVAARSIRDPRFRKTVILILKYDRSGAVGLVVNIPTGISLSSAFPKVTELRKRRDKIFIGGPVSVNKVFLLIRTKKAPEGSLRVFRHTYVSSSMSVLKSMALHERKGDRFRVFAGYAGWAPGQLERELASGSWYVMDADEKLVFSKDTSLLWQELISMHSGIMVRLLPNGADPRHFLDADAR